MTLTDSAAVPPQVASAPGATHPLMHHSTGRLHLFSLFTSCRTRLSRQITLAVFTSFMVIEGVILIPSVIQQGRKLETQINEVTGAKIEWLVQTYPNASPEEILDQLKNLQQGKMRTTLRGVTLYRASNGQELGSFGEKPQLSLREIQQRQVFQQWFQMERRYDAAWLPSQMRSDYILVIRHDAMGIQQNLFAYTLRILGLVLLISAVITTATMIVVQSMVILPILKLRDRLLSASLALQQDTIDPTIHLIPDPSPNELGDVMVAFNQSFLRNYEEITRRKQAETEAQVEREKAETLLLNILPEPIAQELKQGRRSISDGFAEVTVLFADIVGFTDLSTRVTPTELVELLNQIFSAFDELSDRYDLEKIKTIGDNYMVAGGLPVPRADHAEAIANMALEMQAIISKPEFQLPDTPPLNLRIGINTGPVVAGVIGNKKFIYDLWGDAVNTASRMESHSLPGHIQVTVATYERLKDQYEFEERGTLLVKGKGEMLTYWLKGRKSLS